MNLIRVRVDDRLIHGQVVVGCCETLGLHRLILANDEVAEDPLQTRLYRSVVPKAIELKILTVDAAASYLRGLDESADRKATLVVLETPQDVSRLIASGAKIAKVILGGIHHHEASREIWPGYFLDEAQMSALRELLHRGISVEVQSIPGARRIDGRAALESH